MNLKTIYALSLNRAKFQNCRYPILYLKFLFIPHALKLFTYVQQKSPVAEFAGRIGAKIFRQAGCIACHKVNGQGGPSGPDLTRVGAVRTEQAWLRSFLKDPAVVVPGSRMPPFDDLTEDEVRSLTAYLLSLK